MDAISDPLTEVVTIMTSARVGKTEVLNNTLGYFIDQDSCPILMVQPTVDDARTWSKDQLEPMIRDTACLARKVYEYKSRDKKSTILHKLFPGGFLKATGANAPTGLARTTIRVLLLDEIDRYPVSAGAEGDPVRLAEKRTLTFWNRKIIRTSTPTIAGLSRIEKLYADSSQCHYYVPCPECGHKQVLVFSEKSQFKNLAGGYLVYDKANLSWVYYECGNCRYKIDEKYKNKMLSGGEWRARHPERAEHKGFHINEFYSPWSDWRKIVKGFIESKSRSEQLKVWINTTLGETFKEYDSREISKSDLEKRREKYTKIPEGVIFLTAGVDVQQNRVESKIKGWGLKDESWFIARRIFYGSPDDEEMWSQLDDFLNQTWQHEDGYTASAGRLGGLLAVGVDSSAFTDNVYEYVRRNKKKRYWAIKGLSGFGRPIVYKAYTEKKRGTPLIIAGVDTAKEKIYDRVEIDEAGPGCMHFNQECDDDYFDQLTAEEIRVVRNRYGYPERKWVLSDSKRNEALDCEVYNLVMYTLLDANMESLKKKLSARKSAWKKQHGGEDAGGGTDEAAPEPKQKKRKKPKSNWVMKW